MSQPVIYPHQRQVFAELYATASTFFSGEWQELSVRPRFSRFVVGPTGTGKTHLIRALADALSLPIFAVSATNWLPLGINQRGGRSTWTDLIALLGRHPQVVVFLDEADKLCLPPGSGTGWQDYLRVEIFHLLDGALPDNATGTEEDWGGCFDDDDRELVQERLRTGTYVVAAGAFQEFFDSSVHRPRIGFGQTLDGSGPSTLSKEAMAKILPRELVNRFASPVLLLPDLVEDDYWAMLDALVPSLPPRLLKAVLKLANREISEAVSSAAGCRWVEELVLRALIQERSPIAEK